MDTHAPAVGKNKHEALLQHSDRGGIYKTFLTEQGKKELHNHSFVSFLTVFAKQLGKTVQVPTHLSKAYITL